MAIRAFNMSQEEDNSARKFHVTTTIMPQNPNAEKADRKFRANSSAIDFAKKLVEEKNNEQLYSSKRQKEFCPNFVSYDSNLFVLMKDVVIDRRYARGKRGAEEIKDVMNQSEESEYYRLKRGFFKLLCPGLSQHYKDQGMTDLVWKYHLKDWFKAIQSLEEQKQVDLLDSNVQSAEDNLTIAVVRYEYANLFHTMTDWYNAFYVMKVFGKSPTEAKILFIDGHPKGHLDITWKTLFKSVDFIGRQVMHQIKYSKLVWNIVGYESAFSKNLLNGGSVPKPLEQFSDFFLQSHGIARTHQQNRQKLNILFLWRRDYLAHPRQINSFKEANTTIQRKIYNEEEILSAVQKSFPTHTVNGVQLDLITMKEQLEIIGK